MDTITGEERSQIVVALDREAARLEGLVKEYRSARAPNNPVVKAMADEGRVNMEERIKELRALSTKLRGKPPGGG